MIQPENTQEVIDILENYHASKEAEADAMGFDVQAAFHKNVASWLKKYGVKVLQRGLANKES